MVVRSALLEIGNQDFLAVRIMVEVMTVSSAKLGHF
jgi:hypothetical protein